MVQICEEFTPQSSQFLKVNATYWLLVILLSVSCGSSRITPIKIHPDTLAEVPFSIPATRPQQQDLERAIAMMVDLPGDSEKMVETAILYQTLSQPDRWDYLDAAIQLLEKAQPHLPNRPEVAMYLGLSKAAKAKSPEVGLFSKLGLAREGFEQMDQAVTMDPKNLSLRLLRAKASLIAPAILGRSESLQEDFSFIKQGSLAVDEVPLHLLAMSFIFLGDHAHRKGEDSELARSYYQQAIQAGRGTDWEEKAHKRLKGEPSDF